MGRRDAVRGRAPSAPQHYTFKTRPYRHQVVALKRALKSNIYGALWEPRTGKSKFIVDWASILYQQGHIKRLLIICPLSVVGVWEDEFETHCPIPYSFRVLGKSDRKIVGGKGLTVLVTNYDLAWRRAEIIGRYRPDFVVADESHRIKKPSARRSRYLRRLNKVQYRAILTGTPTPKSYLDIYGQWAFLNPKRFGTSIAEFKDQYIRFGGYMGYQIKGYRNFEELKAKIDADSQAVLRKDVFDVPREIFQRVPVQLEPKAWQAYYRMAYELFLELRNGEISDAKNVAVKLLRLQQITGGWIKSDEGNLHQVSKAKITVLDDRLEDLWDGHERVVVFARFKPELDAITAIGTRRKIPTYVVRGGIGREERDEGRRAFQARPGPSLFLAQIQAGGLGIPLHSSHEVIFYSLTHAYDDYKQALDRVHGTGQASDTVRYQQLVCTGTTDLDIYENLRRKQDTMALLMTNKGRRKLIRSLATNLGIDPS